MAVKAEASAVRGWPGVHHPNPARPINFPFVASGLAPPTVNVNIVLGRLVDQTTNQIFNGAPLPLPDPHRWAIYFRRDPNLVRKHPFTLEVFGIAIDPTGRPAVVWNPPSVAVRFTEISKDEIQIGWPDNNENDLCPSDFVPYGTYDPAGTIDVTLSGGYSNSASSIYYDPTDGIWAAQFDPFDPPTDPCDLDATLTTDAGTTTAPTTTGLVFQDC